MKIRGVDVAKLQRAPALMTREQHDDAVDRLTKIRAFGDAANYSLISGADTLLHLRTVDRQAAEAAAAAIAPAREAARLFRRLALLYETGASRTELAISTRPDGAAILAAVAREPEA